VNLTLADGATINGYSILKAKAARGWRLLRCQGSFLDLQADGYPGRAWYSPFQAGNGLFDPDIDAKRGAAIPVGFA